MAFIFQFVNVVYYIDSFAYTAFLDKPNLIMVYELFDVLLNSVCSNFIEDFCIYVHQCYWPVVFFFLSCLCLILVSGCWWLRRMSLEVFFPLQFLKEFYKDRH